MVRTDLDTVLMVPPMTPTVSTSAPFGAIKEVALCPPTALSRLMSAAAASIFSLANIVLRSYTNHASPSGIEAVRLLGEEMLGIGRK
jgi:hypothetical protein